MNAFLYEMYGITYSTVLSVQSLLCSCNRLLIHISDVFRVPFNTPSRRSLTKVPASIKVNDVK